MQGKWTKKSYDALYVWVAGGQKQAEAIMLADGLNSEVDTLKNMPNLGVWYRMTRIAANAVGPNVAEASAREAEEELTKLED